MTEENKQRVRDQIKNDNAKAKAGYEWHIVDGILGERVSVLAWKKEVKLIYVDMDGYPQFCTAYYDNEKERFIGVSDWVKGNVMCAVIAYRMLTENEQKGNE